MLVRIKIFCFLCLQFFVFEVQAQQQKEKLSLKKILKTIELQHNVNFSYLTNDIESLEILGPDSKLTLQEKINFLENNSTLFFDKTAEGYYTILKNKNKKNTSVCGYVYSTIDNLPLENATIQCTNGTTIITNKVGYFEFESANKTLITISHIGFLNVKTVIFTTTENGCKNYFLEPEIKNLEEVTANRYIATGINKSSDGSLIFKPKKLGLLPGLIEADILQSMQQIPGINSVDESVSSINVRGGTNDQNLFLWNGIKMFQTGHFFGLIAAFNPNLAHTITISKNGSSAFYGESVSSVIAINTNPEKFEKDSFGFGLNLINADIYSKINITKTGFIEISGRKSITEFANTPTYKSYFTKAFQNSIVTDSSISENYNFTSSEKFSFYDATFKYFQKIGKQNHLVLDLITINDRLDVLQSSTIENTFQSEKNGLSQKNYGGNLSTTIIWNKNNTSKLDFNASFYGLNAIKTRIESNQILKQENTVLDTGIRFEHQYNLNSKINLNTGAQFVETGTSNLDEVNNPLFLRKIKKVLRSQAFIIEGKFKDTISDIDLNIGLRSNYFRKIKKTLIEPRLQFNYGFVKNLNLEILAEIKSQTSFQIIDLQDDYFGIEKRRWVVANDSLTLIQKSKQMSINFTYSKNNWLFSFENYYKKVSDINSASQGFQNQLEFSKINGDYKVYGAEILIQKKINNFLSWISYNYADNKYTFPELQHPEFVNNFEIKHTLNWAGIYEHKRVKIALGSKWYSGRPITTPKNLVVNVDNPSESNIEYNEPNNTKLSAFFQVNLSSTYRWKDARNRDLKLGCSILNILNTKNTINTFYRINKATNTIETVKTNALFLTPNLSFRMNF